MYFKCIALVSILAAVVVTGRRIVGGSFAEKNQFPHQIALFYDGKFRCGGSIIDSQWILTAAHCVLDGNTKLNPSLFEVYAGSIDLNAGGKYFDVEDTFAHESYGSFMNDIALMKLKTNITFDSTMRAIELNHEELIDSSEVIISGFGRIKNGGPTSDLLKYTTMTVESEKTCQRATGMFFSGIICFNSDLPDGACNGDSGGPAIQNGKVVGVANFVLGGCATSAPDGYAKVAHFVDWIQTTISSNK
ncbi:serine protease SP24D-like [Uranotaenia lowii]|uniref:serine protease SP24D-like n=1 Tax=Uranotaenia lowii TaxID=190385 RepID=UPI002479C43F|nr:serine protease SP24D-like [Uranotaenia lowii]